MPAVVSLGEALFDLFAGPPGTTLADAQSFTPKPGGASANVAIGLSRLGGDVGFVGLVGEDPFGVRLLELLRTEGVDTTHCLQVAGSQTTIALVAASSPVEQDFLLFRGADALIRPEHLDRSYLADARVIVCGSVTLSASGREAALQAARWAREDGVLVAFDANYRPAAWSGDAAARETIVPVLRHADIVKLNLNELELLFGTDDLRRGCQRILGMGVKLCLITLGANGAYFDDGCSRGRVPGFATKVVDTTGCGDAFLAAFLGGLTASALQINELGELEIRRLVEVANAAGAINATRHGAISGLPNREAIDALMLDVRR